MEEIKEKILEEAEEHYKRLADVNGIDNPPQYEDKDLEFRLKCYVKGCTPEHEAVERKWKAIKTKNKVKERSGERKAVKLLHKAAQTVTRYGYQVIIIGRNGKRINLGDWKDDGERGKDEPEETTS
jgi:hypothetical protein